VEIPVILQHAGIHDFRTLFSVGAAPIEVFEIHVLEGTADLDRAIAPEIWRRALQAGEDIVDLGVDSLVGELAVAVAYEQSVAAGLEAEFAAIRVSDPDQIFSADIADLNWMVRALIPNPIREHPRSPRKNSSPIENSTFLICVHLCPSVVTNRS
jgi:hypothetical protein